MYLSDCEGFFIILNNLSESLLRADHENEVKRIQEENKSRELSLRNMLNSSTRSKAHMTIGKSSRPLQPVHPVSHSDISHESLAACKTSLIFLSTLKKKHDQVKSNKDSSILEKKLFSKSKASAGEKQSLISIK